MAIIGVQAPIAYADISCNVGLVILKCMSHSLSSECFGIMTFQKCLTLLRSQTTASKHKITCQPLLSFCRFRTQVIYDVGKSPISATSIFITDTLCQFPKKWWICSLEHDKETLLALFANDLCNFQFCAQVKYATLDGNIASLESPLII